MRLISSIGSGDTTIDVDTLYQPASTDGLLFIIQQAWIGIETAWAGLGANPQMVVDLWWTDGQGPGVPGTMGDSIFNRDPTTNTAGTDATAWPVIECVPNPAGASAPLPIYIRGTGVQLALRTAADDGTISDGLGQLFAIIATPAA